MRRASVCIQDELAGHLLENEVGHYIFSYRENYYGPPVSLTMPTKNRTYSYEVFPPFFEGLLPEGNQLDALLRQEKIDKKDYFKQLVTVGQDLVGDVTIKAAD